MFGAASSSVTDRDSDLNPGSIIKPNNRNNYKIYHVISTISKLLWDGNFVGTFIKLFTF